MRYGFAEIKRTTRGTDTSWWWLVQDPDDEDREDQNIEEPSNSLFWHYPEIYSKEQVVQKMLDKREEELHDEFLWAKHSFDVIKKSAERYLKDGNSPEDFDRTEVLPTDEERIEKAREDFREWYEDNGNKLYDKNMEKAWIACFKKENFIKENDD
jgi:hypothetical protein